MKYRFFILGLVASLFAACAVNEEDHSTPAIGTEEEFYATIEGTATKAFVDDQLRVLWNADDRVSIFNRTTYNRQYRFDGRDGANSGTFVRVPNDDFVTSNPLEYVYSVYPYNSNTEISNDGELTVYLLAEQSYREDSFGLGANTMIAVADDNELMFKNLCGYVMLRLYGTDVSVTSISLKGNRNEPLAGKATVTADVEAAPELQMDASATQEVTLKMDTPVTLGSTAETATTFWLVVPPTTFERGISLTVTNDRNGIFEKATTKSLEISRNTLSRMSALEVVMPEPIVPEAVDLGLPSGVKWASFNLGASKPEEYGDYFAWGETEPYYAEGYSQESPCTHWRSRTDSADPAISGYNWASYKWCMGSNNTLTRYCTDSSYGYNGFTDGNTELDLEDDAAYAALGDKWRMPTDSEWTELREKCTWEWTDNYNGTGVTGMIVTSNVDGYKDKSVFLPAAGYRYHIYLGNADSNNYYWSSSLCTDNPGRAWSVYFNSGDVSRGRSGRYYGFSVRPVYAERAPLPSGSGTEADPYLIRTAADLQGMATKAVPESTTYFKLVNDIDMTGVTEYTPINVDFGTAKQGVVIDGNHKVISNWNWVNTTSKYPGLVAVLDGVIKDLVFADCNIETQVSSPVGLACGWCGASNASLHGRLENVHAVRCSVVTSVDGTNHMGGLVGSAHNTEIIDCSFDGRVERTVCTKTAYIGTGGLVGGYPSADATGDLNILENCSTSGSVIDISRSCGGVVGFQKPDCKVNFKNIHSTADIHNTKDMVGGLVGYYGGGVFTDCWYKGNIVSQQTGSSFVGGIVPHNNWGMELYRCHSEGTITCPGDIVGGIVGQCNAVVNDNSGPCIIKECWSTMTINGKGIIGGIIGRSSVNWPMTVENCWFSGQINATGSSVGGIVGDAPKNSTVTDCWTDVDITGSFGLGGIAGKMCARLDSKTQYLDIDAASTMTGCIYWGSDIKTTTEGGEKCTNYWSSGAVVGCSCFTNTFNDNYRNPAMTLEVYKYAPLNVLFDHADTDPTHPLVEPYRYGDTPVVLSEEDGDTENFKWFAPYHGKAAAAGSTVSSLAKTIGWDESVWDLSGDYPMLKNNPVPVSTE